MHRLVVDVGTQSVRNIEPKACCLGGLTEVLLLISDIVLPSGHDAGALNPLDRLSKHYAGQEGVRTKAM